MEYKQIGGAPMLIMGDVVYGDVFKYRHYVQITPDDSIEDIVDVEMFDIHDEIDFIDFGAIEFIFNTYKELDNREFVALPPRIEKYHFTQVQSFVLNAQNEEESSMIYRFKVTCGGNPNLQGAEFEKEFERIKGLIGAEAKPNGLLS